MGDAGNPVNVAPIFGAYLAIVDRIVDGSTKRFLERFDNDAMLDCAVIASTSSDFEYLEVNGELFDADGDSLIVQAPPGNASGRGGRSHLVERLVCRGGRDQR